MNQVFILLLLISTFACTSQTKPAIEAENDQTLEEEYADYGYKIYTHKDSIEVIEWVNSSEEGKPVFPDSTVFLYQNPSENLRIAIAKNQKWHTWEISDDDNMSYQARIRKQDFDGKGGEELVIETHYGISPQSTFGSEYFRSTAIWKVDEPELYFEIEHYSYSDDMGRNGDQTYQTECELKVEVQVKTIVVSKTFGEEMGEDCASHLEDIGIYRLKNGIVQKSTKNEK